MNIGVVCYPTYGGSGVVATELGKALGEHGHHVHFITYAQPTRLDFFNENVYYHEVTFENYPLFKYPPYEMALASKIVDAAIHEKLDILHVHYAIPHASSAFMAQQILKSKGVELPFVTTLHGTDITLVGQDDTYEPVVTFSINSSNGVTAVSENLKERTYNHFDVKRDIKVIPNFIDFRRFSKLKKDHFKTAICPNGERLIVHTSNFRKVKRVDDVLKIYKKITEKMPAKLLLVGDGPERQNIEHLSRDLDITEDVRFLGKLDAVEEILSVADLFLMPSEKESFGLAALEAMACEVPVVSTDAGGIPELNIHGETGCVATIGDVDSMAEHSIMVLQDENLPKFKAAALERAKKYDQSMIVPQYEAFYEEVLKNGKA
ncbi:MAG: N-acetyl-alpha-D-glucosaminyl L-malate synthase BshA [Bacteroidota bacterium]